MKRNVIRLATGLFLLVFGLLPFSVIAVGLLDWRGQGTLLRLVNVLSFLCGLVWVAAGLWLLVSPRFSGRCLYSAGIASLLDGSVLMAAALTHVIPCSGPD